MIWFDFDPSYSGTNIDLCNTKALRKLQGSHGVVNVEIVQHIPQKSNKNGPLGVHYGSNFDLDFFFLSANINLCNIKGCGGTSMGTPSAHYVLTENHWKVQKYLQNTKNGPLGGALWSWFWSWILLFIYQHLSVRNEWDLSHYSGHMVLLN